MSWILLVISRLKKRNPSYFLSGPLVRVLEEVWRYFTEEITSGKLSRVSCPQTGTFVWSSLSHTQDPSFLSLSISPGTRPSQGNCCRDTSGAPLAILTLLKKVLKIMTLQMKCIIGCMNQAKSQPKCQRLVGPDRGLMIMKKVCLLIRAYKL